MSAPFFLLTRHLANYPDAWAQCLAAGLQTRCAACRLARAYLAAEILARLNLDDPTCGEVRWFLNSMHRVIRRCGYDPAWLVHEVCATGQVYPFDADLVPAFKQAIIQRSKKTKA